MFIMFFTFCHYSLISADTSTNHLISSYEQDITGDGLNETIELNGELLSADSNYYRNIWLSIKSPFSKEWKIPLRGGYSPELKFIDLNNDHVNDIFFINKSAEDEDAFEYGLYSIANNQIQKLSLPNKQFIQAQYKPNYKINLQLSPYTDVTINSEDRKNDFINEKIYDQKGNLLDQSKPYITPPIHLVPVVINESKGYGLESVHHLKINKNSKTLGVIKTLWYYKNNTWIILQSKWHQKDS